MSHWSAKYVGIPFKSDSESAHGADCWRLARLALREEFKIEVPKLDENSDSTKCEANNLAFEDVGQEWRKDWREVQDPQEGDLIVFRFGPYRCHVGLVVRPPQFLHAMPGTDAVIENYNATKWARRVESFWRHVTLR